MNICITLDYELFLGAKTGTVKRCLIEPLEAFEHASRNGQVFFTIFVDATYLYRIFLLKEKERDLAADYDSLVLHLQQLKEHGHDIQLHIHPHWAYSNYCNGEWVLDHDHYKLSDLSPDEASRIVAESKELLDEIVGYKTSIFRAGGFSAQPTSLITKIFNDSHIIADSTVCPGTKYDSAQQQYDYVDAPHAQLYRFSDDINQPQENGKFLEIPFTMHHVSPVFHWKLAFNRLFPSEVHKKMGDGESVKTTSESIVERMTRFYDCPVTIDGYKANFLMAAYKRVKRNGCKQLTILGHPKLATPYSVGMLERFVGAATAAGDKFITLTQAIHESKA